MKRGETTSCGKAHLRTFSDSLIVSDPGPVVKNFFPRLREAIATAVATGNLASFREYRLPVALGHKLHPAKSLWI